VAEVDDPEVGRIRHIGPILEFSATPGAVAGPSPRSGQHTDDVTAEAKAMRTGVPSSGEQPATSLSHPLAGIRVLDLGLGVAGPYTGRVLADLGADVIKINAMHDTYWAGTHMGLGTNRGKRSIAIDLKHEGGRRALEKLIESADVVATNWRPGAAARLGLDYETLHARFPRLVYCNTRGFEKGPRSALPGTDQTAAALTGTEWEDGACDAGNPPLWSRSNMGDTGNAMLGAIAIVSALYHRERTGEGQAVSTSIVNAGLFHTSYAWIHADGAPGGWEHVDGGQYGLSPYYRLYQCADEGWLFLAAVTAPERDRLTAMLRDAEEVNLDADQPEAILSSCFGRRTAAEWLERLDGYGVPAEFVDESFCRALFDDPEAKKLQLVARQCGTGHLRDPAGALDVR
jgi:crotonobetainyl-CoA:carnitine CoA-transferase CaiB-like acyl-CoA transferase